MVLAGALGAFALLGLAIWSTKRHGRPSAAPTAAALEQAARDARSGAAAAVTEAPTLIPVAVEGPSPRWIWLPVEAAPGQRAAFRRVVTFAGPPRRVELRWSADDEAAVLADGAQHASSDAWETPGVADLTSDAADGQLEVIIAVRNRGGPAGLAAVIDIVEQDGSTRRIVTDAAWSAAAPDATEPAASPAREIADYGAAPWGEVVGLLHEDINRHIAVVEGFTVELVYRVPRSQGSWVSLATDDKGRLIASDQQAGLFRITPAPIGGDASATRVEALDLPLGAAQGLLCVDNALYVVCNEGRAQGPGLYVAHDRDGDDVYEEWRLIRAFEGGGEHGPHGVIQGPDGLLYVVGGNHTKIPAPERSAAPRVWDEDLLLPRLWDAGGHAVGILAPGGWVCRTSLEGETWELFSIGFRNAYDLAFNEDGELFTYDADMEWDMGAPWYRPTRICHVTSGSEFGWRSGTGKWPAEFPDNLPPVIDMGPGSPTGVVFGANAAFPERYRTALFALDWTFGTIHAIHLEPAGATYSARRETFLTGRPLPLADVVINPFDGAMYFVVGGRGVPSAIYRVRAAERDESADRASREQPSDERRETELRTLRRELEGFHAADAPEAAIDLIWRNAGHADRFVRFAARTALEHQPATRWAERVGVEPDARRRIHGAIALARVGGAEHRSIVIDALRGLTWKGLESSLRLDWLRAWQLAFIRMGKPSAAEASRLAAIFEPLYPAGDDLLDRALCDLLVYLDSPRVVARTIPLMETTDRRTHEPIDRDLLSRSDAYGQVILRMASAPPQRQQVHYALALRNATVGWTPDLRERYFRWFDTARRTSGGLSFSGFLEMIRRDALSRVPPSERAIYETIGTAQDPLLAGDIPQPRGPGRQWTVDDLVAMISKEGLTDRDYDNGARMYAAARCTDCHRFAGLGRGGAGGPDLTALSTRFSVRDLAEAIIEPSRTISDQYQMTEFALEGGGLVIGRIMDERDGVLRIMQSMLVPDLTVDVEAATITERRPSAVSPMMPALLDRLNAEEVKDLLAYLLSEGDSRNPMFRQPGASGGATSGADADGFVPLFDGRTPDRWEGDLRFWKVENGEIVGRATAANPLQANTFLIWRGSRTAGRATVGDFELRAEVRLLGNNNSGIQYRARQVGDFGLHGYQCDIHPQPDYTAMLYEEGGRGIVATRPSAIRIAADGSKSPLDGAALGGSTPIALDQWREYTIRAVGNRLEHRIDGEVTIIVIDEQQGRAAADGLIGLQLHSGGAYEVRFRNIRLKRVEGGPSHAP